MYMKYEISDVTGHVQEIYSKSHVSLIWEMCRTHQISGIKGNVQEMSCVLILELYLKCEISNTTGMSYFLVLEIYMKREISIS